MSAYARKLKFVNFYKLYLPLTYNPEIRMQASEGESDSHLTFFYLIKEYYCTKNLQY